MNVMSYTDLSLRLSGSLLSAILDEAWELETNSQGLLFGRRESVHRVSTSDIGEDVTRIVSQIRISSFINMRHHRPFHSGKPFLDFATHSKIQLTDEPKGLLIIRRDKHNDLSFNDMKTVKDFSVEFPEVSPVAVLIVNVPRQQNDTWIFSSQHTLMLFDPSKGVFSKHELDIENSEKEDPLSMNVASSISSLGGFRADAAEITATCNRAAISGLQSYYDMQFVMSDMMKLIKDEMLETLELDREICILRDLVQKQNNMSNFHST